MPKEGIQAEPEQAISDIESEPTVQSNRPPSVSGVSPTLSPRLPALGAVVAGKYRLDRLLGQGGMGAVFAATQAVSDKPVAIKWMLPVAHDVEGATSRFTREARATARINHPNVVDIYDVGIDGGSAYLVMELLHGETLAERIDRAPLKPADVVAVLMPAMRGVSAAHEMGVIHRDLKPDNIFLCTGPGGEPREPKVLDFGISKIAAGDSRIDKALTQSWMVMGTPYYMSPEQVRGIKEVDERGDIYAFGVILYEMLTDTYPFQGETYNQLILQIATANPVPIRELNQEVPEALAEVVMRAMAREPGDRYQTVPELARALEPFSSGTTFDARPTLPSALSSDHLAEQPRASRAEARRTSATARRTARRRRFLTAGLSVATAAVVLGAYYAFAPASPARHVVEPAPAVDGSEAIRAEQSARPKAVGLGAADADREQVPEPVVEGSAPARDTQSLPAVLAGPARDNGRTAPAQRKAPRERRRVVRERRPKAGPDDDPALAIDPRAEPATGARRRLPDDWDERLPTGPVVPAGASSKRSGSDLAGQLSLDDL